MKKTHNINIGGYPFTIDEDAYNQMDIYLRTIKRHFSKAEGSDEIMSDIETRIAELFNEDLDNQPIINIANVENIKAVMGNPEDFGASAVFDDEPYRSRHDNQRSDYSLGKKLFRDPENKKIGGVCSGLAAYFGFKDVLIVRIITFVIVFFTGIGIIPYLLLWAFLPQARTASDRLAMQGKPINIDSIGRMFEEEIDSFSDTVSDIKDEFRSKKK